MSRFENVALTGDHLASANKLSTSFVSGLQRSFLKEFIALSLNVSPHSLRQNWQFHTTNPTLFTSTCF